jgi:5-methylcytosine-specific restriction endonuclease McrBC GTP-binding regulatory subunit McrB
MPDHSNMTASHEQLISQLAAYITAHGFYFPRKLLTTYYLSLQTKPFVILTGISGTGKTKLAQLFAEWMSPGVEVQTEIKEEPENDATSFYREIKPSYLTGGFSIPKNAYRYFDIPEPSQSTYITVQLGEDGPTEQYLIRHQQYSHGKTAYVYFALRKSIREWMNEHFEIGDIMRFEHLEDEGIYRISKFTPTVRRILKRTPRLAFVTVRPDWTDNRGLLGFYNLITGTYQATDFLRLLLQASVDVDIPHFVILDEMNLAKVEYYFADFLSAMESRYLQNGALKQSPLRLHDLPRCMLAQGYQPWDEDADVEATEPFMCQVRCAGCPLRGGVDEAQWKRGQSRYEDAVKAGFTPQYYVPPRLMVPPNVYFAGTVNVDETTYMFSPKVLDRANTLEFNAVDLAGYYQRTAQAAAPAPADEATRAAFTYDGQFLCLPKSIPLQQSEVLAPYRARLVELNALLRPYTLHFGYRVADEVLLYLWNAHQLGDAAFSLDTAFDYQCYQKILPKFHGSQAKLQEPLENLLAFCHQYAYTRSAAKIQQMLDQLKKEGFASFA